MKLQQHSRMSHCSLGRMQDTQSMFCQPRLGWFFQLPQTLPSTGITYGFVKNVRYAAQYPVNNLRCGKALMKNGNGKLLMWQVFAVAVFALSGTGSSRLLEPLNQKLYAETEIRSLGAIEIITERFIH